MLGRAELCRVIRKAVLGLCYAYGAFAKTESFKLGYLLFGIGHDGYSVASVDFSDNGFDLLLDRKLIFVGESEIALFLFAQADYFARERFTAAMDEADVDGDVDIAQADDLRDAVDVARSLSSRGDVILLSPACSSFDEFSGYEERGRVFKDYVAQLAAAAKSQME